MLDSFTQKDIEKISMEILKYSKSLDVFPTPVDKIVQYCELTHDTKFDLSNVDQSFLAKVSSTISAAFIGTLKQVRGFLDRSEKTIYVDVRQISARQNFVKLHETGHDALPWQSTIIEHLDDDESLSLDAQEQFEAEANYFASATLFQQDRFLSEIEKYDLSIDAGLALSRKFGGSAHAALRRMVEYTDKRCALLVLNKHSGLDGLECTKKNLFHSDKFTDDFGELVIPDRLSYDWVFTQDNISGRRYHKEGIASLETASGNSYFKYHYFNNTYNSFFLIMPPGEYQKSNKKIVLTHF